MILVLNGEFMASFEIHVGQATPCSREEKKYIVFDQLNPTYAKYYRLEELEG